MTASCEACGYILRVHSRYSPTSRAKSPNSWPGPLATLAKRSGMTFATYATPLGPRTCSTAVKRGLRLVCFFGAGAGASPFRASPVRSPVRSPGDDGTPFSALGCCGIHSSRGALQSLLQWPVLPHLKHARLAPPAGRGRCVAVSAIFARRLSSSRSRSREGTPTSRATPCARTSIGPTYLTVAFFQKTNSLFVKTQTLNRRVGLRKTEIGIVIIEAFYSRTDPNRKDQSR